MIYLLFLGNLLITTLIEGLFMYGLSRSRRFVYYSCLGNLLTNPALNLFLLIIVHLFGIDAYWPALFALELCAILAEGLVYRMLCLFRWTKALTISSLLNLASFAAGLLIYLRTK